MLHSRVRGLCGNEALVPSQRLSALSVQFGPPRGGQRCMRAIPKPVESQDLHLREVPEDGYENQVLVEAVLGLSLGEQRLSGFLCRDTNRTFQ